ncbi:MOSC domain containing protein [Verrucomicrobia bacterium]|nr:MOSC domain containing protein [Verrucomicrobiota bacterium]
MAHIVEILIAASPSSAAVPQESVQAVAGRGLQGDRYFEGSGTFSPQPHKPDFEVTLIQQEHIEAFAAASGLPFTPRDARRNLVTSGVDLNAPAGRNFRVGGVLMRGIRLCEPCNYLAKQTFPAILKGLAHRGGLRAQILSSGPIQVGDCLEEVSP